MTFTRQKWGFLAPGPKSFPAHHKLELYLLQSRFVAFWC
jgi:hypothetical protein